MAKYIPVEGIKTFICQNGFVYANTLDSFPGVDIVFCRDCVYRKRDEINAKGFEICPASGMEITDDDFCSYGEESEET